MKQSSDEKIPVKMVVDTTFTNASGNQGGVPMFSRTGKQTNTESLCFRNPDRKDVMSTFQKEK